MSEVLQEYNGHKNYPTWNVILWISDHNPDLGRDVYEQRSEDRAEWLKQVIMYDLNPTYETPAKCPSCSKRFTYELGASMWQDILGWALQYVEWDDVVEALIEEYEDEDDEEEYDEEYEPEYWGGGEEPGGGW